MGVSDIGTDLGASLARNAGHRVLANARIQHSVRDLVADLV